VFPQISGYGLALAGAGIEQDAAYWEWHILEAPQDAKIEFGVAHKKNREFYNGLDKIDEGTQKTFEVFSVSDWEDDVLPNLKDELILFLFLFFFQLF
jgi:hypothetical protein